MLEQARCLFSRVKGVGRGGRGLRTLAPFPKNLIFQNPLKEMHGYRLFSEQALHPQRDDHQTLAFHQRR
jgi:hypothetical protein